MEDDDDDARGVSVRGVDAHMDEPPLPCAAFAKEHESVARSPVAYKVG